MKKKHCLPSHVLCNKLQNKYKKTTTEATTTTTTKAPEPPPRLFSYLIKALNLYLIFIVI